MSAADGLNKIVQSGNSSILTYDDIQTRALDSIRIGNFCGKFLNLTNNVFIGDKAGLISTDVEKSILIGHMPVIISLMVIILLLSVIILIPIIPVILFPLVVIIVLL